MDKQAKVPSLPRIEIVCVGTELLTGKTNLHAASISQKLATIGLSVTKECTVGDNERDMAEVFRQAFHQADIVICCGGLGPTFDDLTREVWSKVVHRKLLHRPDLVKEIREKFRKRHIQMPRENRRQGFILQGADVIPNLNGTAPGQFLMVKDTILILLPGPPRELNPMIDNCILPRLHNLYPGWICKEKKILLVGMPESQIDEMIRPLIKRLKKRGDHSIDYGILASQSVITVKFRVIGINHSEVERIMTDLSHQFRRVLGRFAFGEDNDTLSGVVGRLLRRKKRSLAVAESCTGGWMAKFITDESGSSDYFKEGVVSYANSSKITRLGISKKLLEKYGAVSEPVARAMAVQIRHHAETDFGVSITGIAGPTGGSREKPVGLVYIGCAGPHRTIVRRFQFIGDRDGIRHRSALMALEILRKELLVAGS